MSEPRVINTQEELKNYLQEKYDAVNKENTDPQLKEFLTNKVLISKVFNYSGYQKDGKFSLEALATDLQNGKVIGNAPADKSAKPMLQKLGNIFAQDAKGDGEDEEKGTWLERNLGGKDNAKMAMSGGMGVIAAVLAGVLLPMLGMGGGLMGMLLPLLIGGGVALAMHTQGGTDAVNGQIGAYSPTPGGNGKANDKAGDEPTPESQRTLETKSVKINGVDKSVTTFSTTKNTSKDNKKTYNFVVTRNGSGEDVVTGVLIEHNGAQSILSIKATEVTVTDGNVKLGEGNAIGADLMQKADAAIKAHNNNKKEEDQVTLLEEFVLGVPSNTPSDIRKAAEQFNDPTYAPTADAERQRVQAPVTPQSPGSGTTLGVV